MMFGRRRNRSVACCSMIQSALILIYLFILSKYDADLKLNRLVLRRRYTEIDKARSYSFGGGEFTFDFVC